MILVDTGYLVALASVADQHHRSAAAWAARLTGERLLVSEYVLLETVNALSKQNLRPRASDIADAVRHEPQFELVQSSPALLNAGLNVYRSRPDKDWSLTDCVSFLLMDQHDIHRALTYDHHFEQAGFEALLRREP